MTFDKCALLLSHWADIAEAFIQHDADPLVNMDSQIASLIREAFGVHVPDRAKELEKMFKSSERRWGYLGKYIVPKLVQDLRPVSRKSHQ